MNQDYYELWHMRFDDEDRDYDKLLGIYSMEEKAEQGLALLRDKPGFRDHPDGFEINEGPMNKTDMTEGFLTVWGDEELPPQTVWCISKRGPKDIPIWAVSQEPCAGENGGDFACRLMDEHYGRGNWTEGNDELDQLRKFGNRANLDPRANVPSDYSNPRPIPGAQQVYFALWHRRTDEYDRDHDMLLGIYSMREKAEHGFALLRDKLGFRDYPHSFEITWGRIDETFETEGFVTVPRDQVPAGRAGSSALRRLYRSPR